MTIQTIKRIGIVFSFIAVLAVSLHAFLPVDDPTTLEARADHKASKKPRNKTADEIFAYVDKLNSGEITKEQFSSATIPLSASHKILKEESANKFNHLKIVKEEAKVLDFENWNVFTFIFGAFLTLFLVTITSYVFGKPHVHELLIEVHKVMTLVFMTISLYYLTYCFYPGSDFPRYFHLIAMALIAFVLSTAVMTYIDWKFQKQSIIKLYTQNIKTMFAFIAVTTKEFIDSNKKQKYTETYVKEVFDKIELPD